MKKIIIIVLISFCGGMFTRDCQTNCPKQKQELKDEFRKQCKQWFERLKENKEFITEPNNTRGLNCNYFIDSSDYMGLRETTPEE